MKKEIDKERKKTGERNDDDDKDRTGSQSQVLGPSLSALHVLTHLILTITLGMHHHSPREFLRQGN